MKARIVLTHNVELIVEGTDIEEIYDYMNQTTPQGCINACQEKNIPYSESYGEEYLYETDKGNALNVKDYI